ncbi:thiolase family protein [Kocuria dechangensis]|uniref:thiolase family protein n=1 Tax=Kocuria dechangensis TaxID=1176249 RepID=UPI0016641430|nr:thiolase family protein [Kocuria dechangensis]
MSAPAYLLDGVRVPFGRTGRALAGLTATELGALPIAQLLHRHPDLALDAALLGVVVQAGLGQNPARTAALAGGVDPEVPALTLNSVCLASLESVCDAARRIAVGEGAAYLVGGFDSMSTGGRLGGDVDVVLHDGLLDVASGRSMGVVSDRVNAELGITREDQDAWAHGSHARALAARDFLRGETVPVALPDGTSHTDDQGVRAESSPEALAGLRPAFTPDGTITAGNASQTADGASAGLMVSGEVLDRTGAVPLARIVDWAFVAGPDTSLHLKPARAVRKVLDRQGLGPADVDVYEINEAFAGVAIASARDLGVPGDVVNVHGGAVAVGHPLGASGFRLALTAARALRARSGRRAVATLCGGGGQGLAVLLETVS